MKHIFNKWPTLVEFAKDIGKPYPTVAAWSQRNSIPAHYDLVMIDRATSRGFDLTLEEIAAARQQAHMEKQGATQ